MPFACSSISYNPSGYVPKYLPFFNLFLIEQILFPAKLFYDFYVLSYIDKVNILCENLKKEAKRPKGKLKTKDFVLNKCSKIYYHVVVP